MLQSGKRATPVTSGVFFENKEITNQVVLGGTLEDIKCKNSVSSDVYFKVPCHPSSSLAASSGPFTFSFYSNPVSIWLLAGSHHGKCPLHVSKGCLQALFGQGDVNRTVKPQKKALIITEKR